MVLSFKNFHSYRDVKSCRFQGSNDSDLQLHTALRDVAVKVLNSANAFRNKEVRLKGLIQKTRDSHF